MYSIFLYEVPSISLPCFHRSLLPLQVGSIGFWVYAFLQVVTEVHQHLIRRGEIKVVKSLQLTLI